MIGSNEQQIANHFYYHNHQLFVEQVAVEQLAAQYGTPCYVYSRAAIEQQWQAFERELRTTTSAHKLCYAVKANSNLAVLNLLARLGAGFDIVSLGELERVLAAGGDPAKVIFSGVGKQVAEIERALELGIHCFNVESVPELLRIEQVAAKLAKIAPIALRVNPNVNPKTHPYIATGLAENKFGIAANEALAVYQQAAQSRHLQIIGLAFHIGSQLLELEPLQDALQHMLKLHTQLKDLGIYLQHIDVGGGLGIRYQQEQPPLPTAYIQALLPQIQDQNLAMIIEPGRALVADAGILITRIEYLKQSSAKHFAIVDAAMNDLLRPALYQAWHEIAAVKIRSNIPKQCYNIVGPVCETGDFLGHERLLAVQTDDLLAIKAAGAYSFAMSSNYNSRARVAEVMVDGQQAHLIRAREQITDLFRNEFLLPA